MTTRKSVTLRTFITEMVKSQGSKPRSKSAKAELRQKVVQAAQAAATKGTVRRQDGGRLNVEGVRTTSYAIFNEIVG